MGKAIQHLQIEMAKIRAGKASTAVLDGVKVDYYGTPTPLNQVAGLSTASTITYGQTLAISSLTGGSSTPTGTFTFTAPTTTPSAGVATHGVTFTPSDSTNYNTATTTVTVAVNKATPSVTLAPSASPIRLGQTLASSLLSGGSASVPGTFAFSSPGTVPPLGTSTQSVSIHGRLRLS